MKNKNYNSKSEGIEDIQQVLKRYLNREDIKASLEKYKDLYPFYVGEGKFVLRYKPNNIDGYLRWQNRLIEVGVMSKVSAIHNLRKYNICLDYETENEIKSITERKEVIKQFEPNKLNKSINISNEDIRKQAELFQRLFDTDRECFVRIRCAATGAIYSYNVQDLKNENKLHNILNSKKFTKEDLFYSIATYKTMLSGQENNIFSMHAIVIDVDYKRVKKLKFKTPIEVFNILEKNEFNKTIPIPTVLEIGNQLRLLYKIECVGATRPSQNLIKRIGKIFGQRLIDYGGDTPRLTDSARIVSSINTKNDSTIEVFYIKDAPTYKVSELREIWLDPLPEWYPAWSEKKNKVKVVRFIPKDKDIFYSINMGRIQDFYKIANFFGKELDGRRFLCFQVRNHAKLSGATDEEAKKTMKEFNKNLAKPIAWRVIERDTRNVNKKQYLYKGITILDQLGLDREDTEKIGLQELKYITEEEKKQFKEEYNKKYMHIKFRNVDGMTKTEVKRRNEFIQIARLELKGLSINKIAEELGKAEATIRQKIKRNSEYYVKIKQDVENGLYDEISENKKA